MKNPPRKPKAPAGSVYKWTAPYQYRRVVGKRRQKLTGKFEKVFQTVRVPGFYRLYDARPAAPKLSRKTAPKGWNLAREFEAHYVQEYDAAHVDPIYKHRRDSDVVRLSDGLVWDRPIRSDVRGDFGMGRVWYVVHHGTQDEFYIYVRTFKLPEMLSTVSMAAEEKQKWESSILGEYEDKEYMEVQDFIAWTVFDERDRSPRKLHHFPKLESREKAFATDFRKLSKTQKVLKTKSGKARTVEYEVRRALTRWEIKKVLKSVYGSSIGLRRRKGESLEAAYKRMGKGEKKAYTRALRSAVRALEEKWTKERRRNK